MPKQMDHMNVKLSKGQEEYNTVYKTLLYYKCVTTYIVFKLPHGYHSTIDHTESLTLASYCTVTTNLSGFVLY